MAKIRFVTTQTFVALLGIVNGEPIADLISYESGMDLDGQILSVSPGTPQEIWKLDGEPISSDDAWNTWNAWAQKYRSRRAMDRIMDYAIRLTSKTR